VQLRQRIDKEHPENRNMRFQMHLE
jgi:hypothetical protein